VSDLKDEKFILKKQTYMKNETCKLYNRDFWIFLPNTIKIDRYNFELYRFKVGPFLRHSVEFYAHLSLYYSITATVWNPPAWRTGREYRVSFIECDKRTNRKRHGRPTCI